jgi:hypothetical protein
MVGLVPAPHENTVMSDKYLIKNIIFNHRDYLGGVDGRNKAGHGDPRLNSETNSYRRYNSKTATPASCGPLLGWAGGLRL